MSAEIYLNAPSRDAIDIFEVPALPTAVVRRTGYPMAELRTLFDGGFSALIPALGREGSTPVAPGFALYTRMPTDTVDIEIGIVVDRPLAGAIDGGGGYTVEPSTLPAGLVAGRSFWGGYDGLGTAWGQLMEEVARQGRAPAPPFWEVYVTEPHPGIDPDALRTDLYTMLE